MRGYRNLGFGLILAAWPAPASNSDAEAVLEYIRRRIDGGLAGQEAQEAFLAFLADADPGEAGGCEAWGPGSEASEIRSRHPDLDRALAETCPESAADRESAAVSITPSKAALHATGRRSPRIRTGITHSAKPRRALSPTPYLDQEGAIAPVRWKASLRELRPHARHIEVRAGGASIHAGHLRSGLSRTRLGFVAGSGFYEGWSGTSGASGPLYSPYSALDGLGASFRSGDWTWDAVGTWNRLIRKGGTDSERRDALMYLAGLAREPSRGKRGKVRDSPGFGEGLGFRFQTAHQRFEPATGRPFSVTVAGAAVSGFQGRLRLGLAGSLDPRAQPGGYAEFSAAAPETEEGGFRLEARQASPGWANPLQSPRGYLRDTAGQWFLSGRGEGGATLRAKIPAWAAGSYRISLHPGGLAAWALGREELLAAEGRLAVTQEWGPWTHESGMSLRHRGTGAPSAEAASGWGQTLGWRRDGWKAEAAFLPRGKAYRGTRPAPLHLALGRTVRQGRGSFLPGPVFWKAEVLLGDVREWERYLMLGLRQGWDLSGGIRAVHALRLPWERGDLTAEMGYQLRLEALF